MPKALHCTPLVGHTCLINISEHLAVQNNSVLSKDDPNVAVRGAEDLWLRWPCQGRASVPLGAQSGIAWAVSTYPCICPGKGRLKACGQAQPSSA